jgi:dTDP-4-amino-4,6-dideoxygalactose transaminase
MKLLNSLNLSTWPSFSLDEIEAVSKVLQSNKVNYWTGNEGRLFEAEYAKSLGVKYCVAVMNGTVALEAALLALEIGPGDEVITTPRTFIASASAIVKCGATPILADVDVDSQNITAETISAVLSSKTKAIIAVHLAGWPCEMDKIMHLAKKFGLRVVEDCAQAHGATYKNIPVGAWGDIAAFSFCQDKIITTGGEGGLVATNNKVLWEKVWSLKDHGKSFSTVYRQDHPVGFRWLHDSFGTNWRMTEMQAAIGRIQLGKLDLWVKHRQRNASLLASTLKEIPSLRLTTPSQNIFHAYYRYYVFIKPHALLENWTRDLIMLELQKHDVPCTVGSCGEIYKEKAFLRAHLQPKTELAGAVQLSATSLAFLIHPTLSIEEMKSMAQIIKNVFLKVSIKDEGLIHS